MRWGEGGKQSRDRRPAEERSHGESDGTRRNSQKSGSLREEMDRERHR